MGQGSGLGVARGSIQIDTRDLSRVQAMSAQVGQSVARNLGQIDAGAKKASGGFDSLANSAKGVALAYALIKAAQIAYDLEKTAAVAQRTRKAFDTLAGGVGESGDSMLGAMRKASRGMVSDIELVTSANQAMLLGVAQTNREMTDLLNASRVLGQAMGQDVGKSFNDLVIGLGRLSPRILDNLGIANEGEKIFEDYARSIGTTADRLSNAEKMHLLMNQVMSAAKPLLDAEAKGTGNAADKFDKLETSATNAKKALGDFLLAMGSVGILEAFSGGLDFVSDKLERMARIMAAIGSGDWGAYVKASQDLGNVIMGRGVLSEQMGTGVADIARPRIRSSIDRGPAGPSAEQLADRRQATLDFQREIADIEKSAQAQRLDATRSYESQRSQTIREFEKSVAREEEDWLLQRGRAVAEFNRQVADLQADAAKRDARIESDYAERIAELRADSAKRLSDIEEDYQRNRERAERDHKDRLFDAAARLDAVAVANEQRNFKRQSDDAKEAHDDQIGKLQEQLEERLAEEAKAHQRQLQDNRDADAERLKDMQADFALRRQQEEEDRQIRLERMAQDHADQLAEMDRQQGERIAQINRHEADERAAAEQAHLTEMDKLGVVLSKGWKLVQDAIEKAMLQSYDDYKKELEKRYGMQGPLTRQESFSRLNLADPSTYATGGWVRESGMAQVHAGEYVANSRQAANMVNNRNVGDISIIVNGAPGQSEAALGRAVRDELEDLFRGMMN